MINLAGLRRSRYWKRYSLSMKDNSQTKRRERLLTTQSNMGTNTRQTFPTVRLHPCWAGHEKGR